MHRFQPLVLIFQLFKIFEQRTLTPLSLNPDFVPGSHILYMCIKKNYQLN